MRRALAAPLGGRAQDAPARFVEFAPTLEKARWRLHRTSDELAAFLIADLIQRTGNLTSEAVDLGDDQLDLLASPGFERRFAQQLLKLELLEEHELDLAK